MAKTKTKIKAKFKKKIRIKTELFLTNFSTKIQSWCSLKNFSLSFFSL